MKRINNRELSNDNGLSLLELVTAVGVILVLTLIGLLAYNGITGNARQAAVHKAAQEVYDGALARYTGASKGSPLETDDDWNNSAVKDNRIRTEVTSLGNGRYEVKAWYGESYESSKHTAILTTPPSSNSSETPPIDGEDVEETPPPVVDTTGQFVFMCDNTTTGVLPFGNFAENTEILVNGENVNVENASDDLVLIMSAVDPEYSTVLSNASQSITMQQNVEYRVKVEGSFELFTAIVDMNNPADVLNSCLRSVESLPYGLKSINYLYAPFLISLPETIPNTVTSLAYAFSGLMRFNLNINNWDVSNVTDMSHTFYNVSYYNQPLDHWQTGKVEYMNHMFAGATSFNQPLNTWDVSNVKDMKNMFHYADAFNQPLNNWRPSNATDMSFMFASARDFNQDLDNWDVSKVVNFNSTFIQANAFNGKLNNWDVSSATDMSYMFHRATNFNQDLDNWTPINARDLSHMFDMASSFNGKMDGWNLSNATDLSYMFNQSSLFNQPLNNWTLLKVTDMSYMFKNATKFNQPLNNWNVSNVTDMRYMFLQAESFNQPLNSWNVSKVTNMASMFSRASSFDQNLGNWKPPIDNTPANFAVFTGHQKRPMEEKPQWICVLDGRCK